MSLLLRNIFISVTTIALIAFSLVVLTKNITVALVFLGITALCLSVWTATEISSLRKMNRRVDLGGFVNLNISPFLIAGAVGLSYHVEKGILIPGIIVALLALSLLVMSLVKLFVQGKSDRLIDKQVVGLFIALLFIDFIVSFALSLFCGLGHSACEQIYAPWRWLLLFVVIVACPIVAVILARYYRRSTPEHRMRAKAIIFGAVLTLFLVGTFLLGRLGIWPLMVFAAQNDIRGLEKLLIHAGFNPNVKERCGGWTPLRVACSNGDIEMAELLLEKGAGNKPEDLVEAAFRGQTGIMNLLLEKGADVNGRTSSGMTALMWSAGQGNLGSVKFLIARGADVIAKDHSGKSVLMYACKAGQSDIVKLLIEQEHYKGTELSYCKEAFLDACWKGDLLMVRKFLERGMDVNSQNDFRWTALMSAASKGHRDVVEYLLTKGADVSKSDFSGKTALSLAVEKGHSEIRDILLKYGAKQ